LDQPQTTFRESVHSRFGDTIVTEHFSYTSYGKTEMLYDLRDDPQENTNIAAKPTSRETVERMKVLLKQRQQEAGRFVKQ
jgi:hypothetical protein